MCSICEYWARLNLYHMDLYRIDDLDEIIDLGLDDYFLGDGVCVVEWAEKGIDTFIGEHLTVNIVETGSDSRELTITADSSRYSQMMRALIEQFSDSGGKTALHAASGEVQ